MNNTRWSKVVGKDVEGKTSEDTIKLAGLDWKVKQAPVQFEVDGGITNDNSHLVNYRDDNKLPLGIVGTSYEVLQNAQMFKWLDGIVGSMEAMFVNAGSFKGGRKVYIQAKLPGQIHFDDGDDIGEKFLTFISSHDGSMAVSSLFTPTRIVCQNTLVMALHDGTNMTNIRHTASMAVNLRKAQEVLNLVNGQVTMLEEISRKLIGRPFTDSDMKPYLEKIGMVKAEEKKSTRALNVIDEVLSRFHHGKGSELKSSKGTSWGAYNAVTEYVDHFKGSDNEKRAESSLIGQGARIKDKALHVMAG